MNLLRPLHFVVVFSSQVVAEPYPEALDLQDPGRKNRGMAEQVTYLLERPK